MERRRLLSIVMLYAGAVAAGYTTSKTSLPLPWMITPLVTAAIAGLAGRNPGVPGITRPVAQLIIGASVGLLFTPDSLGMAGEHIAIIVIAAALTILAGLLAAMILMRLAGIDAITATLACIPVGPVEMASLATRHGVEPGPVALAQLLRIVLLVLIFPPILIAISGGPEAPVAVAHESAPADYSGIALLLLLAICGSLIMRLARAMSPFFLGSLAAGATASALMLPVSPPPYLALVCAQVLLGVWLGSMFDRTLFERSGPFVVAILASTSFLLVVCASMAVVISAITGIEWPTIILATAPGSLTEMVLTAKILQQGVVIVTAFHLIRIFIIPLLIPPLLRIITKKA